MIGASETSIALRAMISQLAASGIRAALITGESGTGKELAAGLLHAEGPRRDAPFIEVNCSAITETLFESELFGHERGAFTGAVGSRRGLAEMADGGTLFLDEIGDMPLSCQAKLLRFLDDQTFLRVGGTRKVRVNTQIVAATNRDLKAMVAEGTFRGDLYYRLLVAPIALTPLRARPDDILPLAGHWLRRISAQHGNRVRGFTPEAEQRLLAYAWPGNVREMRNLIERLVICAPAISSERSSFPGDRSHAPRVRAGGCRLSLPDGSGEGRGRGPRDIRRERAASLARRDRLRPHPDGAAEDEWQQDQGGRSSRYLPADPPLPPVLLPLAAFHWSRICRSAGA
jgi:DNA-binding NtrC family response regulator